MIIIYLSVSISQCCHHVGEILTLQGTVYDTEQKTFTYTTFYFNGQQLYIIGINNNNTLYLSIL